MLMGFQSKLSGGMENISAARVLFRVETKLGCDRSMFLQRISPR